MCSRGYAIRAGRGGGLIATPPSNKSGDIARFITDVGASSLRGFIKSKHFMKREAINNRNSNKPTIYFPAGSSIKIPGLGEFPCSLQRGMQHYEGQYWSLVSVVLSPAELMGMFVNDETENDDQNTFQLAAISADFVYYLDDEGDGDETSSTIMLNRDMQLVSDNWLAYNDLVGLVEKNEGLLWISDAVKYWQKEQYVKPEMITAEIKTVLDDVDIESLSDEERVIYFAYLSNGPVKYTKPESLMAVLSNDLDQDNYSYQLAAILEMLEE